MASRSSFYLTYLRDRLILSKEILADTGSIFVQIGDENVHRVRLLLDEVFGSGNFVNFITFSKTSSATVNYMAAGYDYLLWYARDRAKMKYRQVFGQKTTTTGSGQEYTRVELQEGIRRIASDSELNSPENLPVGSLIYRPDNMTSQSIGRDKGAGHSCWFGVNINGRTILPNTRSRWKTNQKACSGSRERSGLKQGKTPWICTISRRLSRVVSAQQLDGY